MSSRAALALPLLLQSPPGQQSQVYADLVALLESEGDDGAADAAEFQAKAQEVWRQHNVEQLITIDAPALSATDANGNSKSSAAAVVLSEHGVFSWKGQERFRDPRSKTSFVVDHYDLKASDPQPYKPNEHAEPLREAIEADVAKYVFDRYETGIASVFVQSLPRPEPVKKPVKAEDPIAQEANPRDAVEEGGEEVDGKDEAGSEVKTAEDEDARKDTEEKAAEVESKEDSKDTAAEGEDSEMGNRGEEGQAEASAGEDATAAPATDSETKEKEDAVMAEREDEEEKDEEASGPSKLFIHIVANKIKLSNFWSGRWRATYTFDPSSPSSLDSTLALQVHYFEDGNVQLHGLRPTSTTLSLPTSAADPFDAKSAPEVAKAIASAIEKHEEAYQKALFATCNDLGERAFKALRKTLPITKQKVDWDKVLNYKLGSELSR